MRHINTASQIILVGSSANLVAIVIDTWPWLLAMFAFIGLAAFFSASEAALFMLRSPDRCALMRGGPSARAAAHLLDDPERVLSAVLFWNHGIILIYFTIGSSVSLRISDQGGSMAAIFAFGSLLVLIFFSEMLPKSIGVLNPQRVSTLVGLPLATLVCVVDPMLPVLRTINLLSRRLIWPRFEPEKYLDTADIERAIRLSTDDADMLASEQMVLRNIVSMSDIRMDEIMQPRLHFQTFRLPVTWEDIKVKLPPNGYLFLTDEQGDDVVAFVNLQEPTRLFEKCLDTAAEPVVYVPWCAAAPDALEMMQTRDCEVAVVVNEMGETIGVATFEDMLTAMFAQEFERSDRLLEETAISKVDEGVWRVTGMTSIRQLTKYFQRELLPSGRSVTIAGVLQAQLQRLPVAGDKCHWAGFAIRVLENPKRGYITLELILDPDKEMSS